MAARYKTAMTNARRLAPSLNRAGPAAAHFVLTELQKVGAYANLSEEDRGSIAVAVAHISAKFYLDGCGRPGRCDNADYRGSWFRGCWVGPSVAGLGAQ